MLLLVLCLVLPLLCQCTAIVSSETSNTTNVELFSNTTNGTVHTQSRTSITTSFNFSSELKITLACCGEGCSASGYCVQNSNRCYCEKINQIIDKQCQPPICSADCGVHGKCIDMDRCQCNEGYTFQLKTCMPFCEPCSPNSKCVAPHTCECNHGYTKTIEGGCQPICTKECFKHSTCIAPNDCKCDDGYVRITNTCIPKCSSECGENSSCLAPDKCECNVGFKRGDSDKNCVLDRTCIEEINLIFMQLRISCDYKVLLLFLFYTAIAIVILNILWFAYKGLCQRTTYIERELQNNSNDYVITYQPINEQVTTDGIYRSIHTRPQFPLPKESSFERCMIKSPMS